MDQPTPYVRGNVDSRLVPDETQDEAIVRRLSHQKCTSYLPFIFPVPKRLGPAFLRDRLRKNCLAVKQRRDSKISQLFFWTYRVAQALSII